MTQQEPRIERLMPPVGDADLRALAHLLIDAVESGAAVSFLAPLTVEGAEDWWRKTLSAYIPQVRRAASDIFSTELTFCKSR